MPWVDELSEPHELKRCIRDLVALSTLPAIWKDHSPRQIADSVAAALLSMLHADVVHVTVPSPDDDLAVEVTRMREAGSGSVDAIFRGLRFGRPDEVRIVDNPLGPGPLRLAAAPIGFGGSAMIIVGSADHRFPSETHRLLLGIAANDATIALQRWQAVAQQRRTVMAIERSSEFVGFAAMDGRAQYVNAAGCDLMGLSGDRDVQRLSIFDFIVPEERARARGELMPLVAQAGRWIGELNFRHFKTGEVIPFLVDWFCIDEPRSGRPMSMATVSRDLRGQKKLEAHLRGLNESLEQRVAERTSELANALSRVRIEVAERERADAWAHELQVELFHASRLSAAGQMAAALAHELNQPLTALMNSVNAGRRMLTNGAHRPIEKVLEVLDEAAEQAMRTGEIIRRLRDFVTRGETDLHAEDLQSLIYQACDLVSAGTGANKMRAQLHFDPRAALVLGNRVQLQQVMFNLMRNAHEAMAGRERYGLDVTTRRLDDDTIEIVVADHGPGLPSEILDHVFEAFQTTKRDGMGLGLSICSTIVEAHGGKLRYAPNPGGGAAFIITLPAAPE